MSNVPESPKIDTRIFFVLHSVETYINVLFDIGGIPAILENG